MKLFAEIYPSPQDNEGTYQNVYIEDVSYQVKRNENLFSIDFEMYHFKNDKRVKLDEFKISFRGSNADLENGLPTTNKTAIIKLLDFIFDPEIPQFLETANPEYDENIEGSQPILYSPNPAYIPESGEIPLLQYLYNHGGQMPESYEVVEWGFPTYTDALQYFDGGTLDNPELLITNPFAKEWLKNTIQMKGEPITQFNFID